MDTFCIYAPEQVTFEYQIHDHLRGISTVEDMRQTDLDLLKIELRSKGTTLEQEISQGRIWRMKFPGMILDAKALYSNDGTVRIQVYPIHPHRADLTQRATHLERRCPITVNAIIVNQDHQVILAPRTDAPILGVIPGGHVEYDPQNPQSDSLDHLLNEFKEELGFAHSGIRSETPIICVHDNKDIRGINVLHSITVKKSFREILELWKKAKDRYEHSTLLSAPGERLDELAHTGKTTLAEKPYETTLFFQDCIRYFLGH